LVTFLIAFILLSSLGIISLVYAFIIAYVLCWRIIKRSIDKRTMEFLNQFPDALDMIVRSVRSGFPLNAAVNMVSESMTGVISQEFKQVSDEVAYGSTLVEALERLADRVRAADVR